WLGPDILDHLEHLDANGVTDVLVCPVGFVADHLEIRWDLDHEAQEKAAELGMHLERIEMPNADPAFVRVLAALVRRTLEQAPVSRRHIRVLAGHGEPMPAAREDERSARFRVLYEENYERILGYALRRVEPADALDVVAETFTVAWRRLTQVPAGDDARLWLYGTARRVVANHNRATRRRARLYGRLAEEVPADAAEPSSSVAAAAHLRGCARPTVSSSRRRRRRRPR